MKWSSHDTHPNDAASATMLLALTMLPTKVYKLPGRRQGDFDLLDEHCAAQTPGNHATFNSTNPTNPLLPESPLQDQGEDGDASP